MTCCIGYYPTLTHHPQEIQGGYHNVLNDPLYSQDMWQMIIPLSDESVFKENKPYIPNPDLLTADENYYGKNMGGLGVGYGKSMSVYVGRGVSPSGGGIFETLTNIAEDSGVSETIDRVADDIKKGYQDVKQYVKKKRKERRKKKIVRPLVQEMFKMENKKPQVPAMKLKKKLMRHKRDMKVPRPDTHRKRTEIKNLLERLR